MVDDRTVLFRIPHHRVLLRVRRECPLRCTHRIETLVRRDEDNLVGVLVRCGHPAADDRDAMLLQQTAGVLAEAVDVCVDSARMVLVMTWCEPNTANPGLQFTEPALVIESAVLDHSTAVEAHRAAQRVLGLALVQTNGDAAAQLRAL